MTTYTVFGDYATTDETDLHTTTDLTAAIRFAKSYEECMGGWATVEVIWHMDSGEAVVEWVLRAEVEA
jgi:hypothetical protein